MCSTSWCTQCGVAVRHQGRVDRGEGHLTDVLHLDEAEVFVVREPDVRLLIAHTPFLIVEAWVSQPAVLNGGGHGTVVRYLREETPARGTAGP